MINNLYVVQRGQQYAIFTPQVSIPPKIAHLDRSN